MAADVALAVHDDIGAVPEEDLKANSGKWKKTQNSNMQNHAVPGKEPTH
jgi:hypothetical protein